MEKVLNEGFRVTGAKVPLRIWDVTRDVAMPPSGMETPRPAKRVTCAAEAGRDVRTNEAMNDAATNHYFINPRATHPRSLSTQPNGNRPSSN